MRLRPHRTPRLLYGFLIVLISGCARTVYAPIDQKTIDPDAERYVTRSVSSTGRHKAPAPVPAVHVVAKGDTVHAIAWRYSIDFRDLIQWNELRNPDLIFVGQKLRLRPPPKARVGATKSVPNKTPSSNKAAVAGADPKAPEMAAKPPPSNLIRWTWPTPGKTRPATTVSGSKGIEIRGQRGQAVKAAAHGTVVYSGSGLRGYGELIIIKHNDTFLSAYAHNETRLVPEGQRVELGETIARMGSTDAKDVMLHFEIRKNGKAVDPLKFLPKR